MRKLKSEHRCYTILIWYNVSSITGTSKTKKRFGLRDGILREHLHLKEAYEMEKALPLLPAGDIPAGITYIEESIQEDQRFTEFLQYLRGYWEPCKFPHGNSVFI